MPTQIQLRRGTAAQWTSANPTLAQSEVGVETDTNKFKIGNGSTAWTSLAYAGVTGAASSTDGALVAFDGTTGKVIKANGAVTAAQGGTGQTSFTNGQLLIGNASGGLSKATLTQGSNITITNGDGTITIAASGGGGGTPGGSDTQVQFNDGGSFGGDAGLTYNKTTDVLTATGGFSGPLNGTVGATTANTGAFTTLSATGVATFSAGSASAPAITTSGDTNTGVLFPAADNVAITTAGTERVRVSAAGFFKATNTGSYRSSTGTYHEFTSDKTSDAVSLFNASSTSYTGAVFEGGSARSANSAYSMLDLYSGYLVSSDREFQLRGDGNGYADGTWNNNGADYAEFFESTTGQALTLGATVVLDGNKVREATAFDSASVIIGVVRPKEPSKASMVVGNTAWNKWSNKYLTDDFDRYIMEDHEVVEWTGADGKQHSYESHNLPDGITVPADATRKTHDEEGNKFEHYKLNPAWDSDVQYINRENRPEWNIIGLLGQVKILKGQPVGDRWVKMRDVSATVEEWFIR